MANDVVVNKLAIIERCLSRVHEEYEGKPQNLENFTKQDSIILNIQRACEAAIDLAMHLVAENSWGVPQSSRDAFDILEHRGIIAGPLAKKLKAMIGFRNIAVHNYKTINLDVVRKVIENNLGDFTEFCKVIIKKLGV